MDILPTIDVAIQSNTREGIVFWARETYFLLYISPVTVVS